MKYLLAARGRNILMHDAVNVFWKTITVYVVLVILARLLGKKLLSQMTFSEFVIGITMGTIAGAFVVEQIEGVWVLLSPAILTIVTMGLTFLNIKCITLRKLVEGEPVTVIENGKILEKKMQKTRYNLSQLEMQLREKGIFDISEVEFAVLEPHGQLSILKKSQHLPVTMKDLGKPTPYKGLATDIIMHGDVFEENLRWHNLDFGWLYNELHNRGISNIKNVTLATLQPDGSLYIDVTEDNQKNHL